MDGVGGNEWFGLVFLVWMCYWEYDVGDCMFVLFK